jgi:hypothetical protein
MWWIPYSSAYWQTCVGSYCYVPLRQALKTDATQGPKWVVLISSGKPPGTFDQRPGSLPQVTKRSGRSRQGVKSCPPTLIIGWSDDEQSLLPLLPHKTALDCLPSQQVSYPLPDFWRFSNTQILKSEMVTFLMSKFLEILQVDFLKHREWLFFLDKLQNPKGLQVINSGINSNLNLPWILKEFKPFYKNLINSLKFHPHIIYMNMDLHWLTCIQKLEVPLQVGEMT